MQKVETDDQKMWPSFQLTFERLWPSFQLTFEHLIWWVLHEILFFVLNAMEEGINGKGGVNVRTIVSSCVQESEISM